MYKPVDFLRAVQEAKAGHRISAVRPGDEPWLVDESNADGVELRARLLEFCGALERD